MIKRILKVIVWALCFPLLFPTVILSPLLGIYLLFRFIITGKDDVDIFFKPMEWVINLPYNITRKW